MCVDAVCVALNINPGGKRKRGGRPARSAVLSEPGDGDGGDGDADGDAGDDGDDDDAGEGDGGAAAGTSGGGGKGRKSLHPAVRKLQAGRGGAADEEGVKAMLRSIGRCVGWVD